MRQSRGARVDDECGGELGIAGLSVSEIPFRSRRQRRGSRSRNIERPRGGRGRRRREWRRSGSGAFGAMHRAVCAARPIGRMARADRVLGRHGRRSAARLSTERRRADRLASRTRCARGDVRVHLHRPRSSLRRQHDAAHLYRHGLRDGVRGGVPGRMRSGVGVQRQPRLDARRRAAAFGGLLQSHGEPAQRGHLAVRREALPSDGSGHVRCSEPSLRAHAAAQVRVAVVRHERDFGGANAARLPGGVSALVFPVVRDLYGRARLLSVRLRERDRRHVLGNTFDEQRRRLQQRLPIQARQRLQNVQPRSGPGHAVPRWRKLHGGPRRLQRRQHGPPDRQCRAERARHAVVLSDGGERRITSTAHGGPGPQPARGSIWRASEPAAFSSDGREPGALRLRPAPKEIDSRGARAGNVSPSEIRNRVAPRQQHWSTLPGVPSEFRCTREPVTADRGNSQSKLSR